MAIMEAITIHPENAEQLKTVKAVLKALKVPFELQSNSLPSHVIKSIDKSLTQFEKQEVITFEEFKDKHFSNR